VALIKLVTVFACINSILFSGWWIYIDVIGRHQQWYVDAYSLGVDVTRGEYERLLKTENTPEMLAAKCMLIDYEWINEHNRRLSK